MLEPHSSSLLSPAPHRALRLGVAGPVGTGKSSLIALVCRELGRELSLAVVTNDIYTDEDARFLRSAGVLDPERIRAVDPTTLPLKSGLVAKLSIVPASVSQIRAEGVVYIDIAGASVRTRLALA